MQLDHLETIKAQVLTTYRHHQRLHKAIAHIYNEMAKTGEALKEVDTGILNPLPNQIKQRDLQKILDQ